MELVDELERVLLLLICTTLRILNLRAHVLLIPLPARLAGTVLAGQRLSSCGASSSASSSAISATTSGAPRKCSAGAP